DYGADTPPHTALRLLLSTELFGGDMVAYRALITVVRAFQDELFRMLGWRDEAIEVLPLPSWGDDPHTLDELRRWRHERDPRLVDFEHVGGVGQPGAIAINLPYSGLRELGWLQAWTMLGLGMRQLALRTADGLSPFTGRTPRMMGVRGGLAQPVRYEADNG